MNKKQLKLIDKLYNESYEDIKTRVKEINSRDKPPLNSIKGQLIQWLIQQGVKK